MKRAVVGIGYVGVSNDIILSQHHEVVAIDIVLYQVEMLKRKQLPIVDAELEDYLKN